MKIVVVYNPKSGSAVSKQALKKLFKKAGIVVEAWIDITDNFDRAIAKWTAKGSVIAAIGGDGTIASVANAVAGTNSILAPLPGGTLNHFTKDAGIVQDLGEAILRLVKAKPRRVDLVTVNDIVFLNNSSIGIYPVSLQNREKVEGALGKWPAAVIGSLRAFIQFRLYEVTIDGKTFKTPFVFVGNNNYHIGEGVGRTSINEGVLSVYAVKSGRRRTLVELLGLAVIGRLDQHDDLMTMSTKALTIHAKRSYVHVSTDGEVSRHKTPLVYKCIPGGLKIIGS